MIKAEKLDFWIKTNQNVLFIGKHGVGKTSVVKNAFERNGLNYLYFSGSTMDPFVDFCGVPIQVKDSEGKSSIELVLPNHIDPEHVEAIFIDEYNRTHKKIRNATMELIQFKSINGKKFPKLKIIWAAINPEDEEELAYDVEALDPAQKDRFQVHVEVPYDCDREYFFNKFGEMSFGALEWWKSITKEVKEKISPRRLDYALSYHREGGELRDVLPKEANCSSLISLIELGSVDKKMSEVMKNNDVEEAKKMLSNVSLMSYVEKNINKRIKEVGKFWIPLMSPEQLVSFVSSCKKNQIVDSILFEEFKKNGEKSKIFETFATSLKSGSQKEIKVRFEKIFNRLMKERPESIEKIKITSSMGYIVSGLGDLQNTYDRINCLKEVISVDNECLPKEDLLNKLIVIDFFVSRSQMTTINHVETSLNLKEKVCEIIEILMNEHKKDTDEIKRIVLAYRKSSMGQKIYFGKTNIFQIYPIQNLIKSTV